MEKIDKLIEFFIENLQDERISVFKKMKFGFRHYHISFVIDDNPTTQNNNQHIYQYRESLEIIFDNRNQCIEVYGTEDQPIIIEDKQLLEKWSKRLEEIVNTNIENRTVKAFEKALNDCYNKNLYRELQMKKLFKEDESI